MPFLKQDIRSSMYIGQVYAKAGTEVDIISNRGGILIVRPKTGTGFHVFPKQLSDEPIAKPFGADPALEQQNPSAIRGPKRSKPSAGKGSSRVPQQPSLL